MSGVTGPVETMETSSGTGRALKLQTDMPHLVSMGGDRLSTSVTLHPIPPGRVTLGSGQGVDIPVQGTGVLPLHCHIENLEGVVTIYPLSENLSIDGVQILKPTRLSQGVMLTIGRSNYMRFNHPAEAKLMKSVLPNPRISMTPISFETDNGSSNQPKFIKKPPVVPKKSPRESLSDSNNEDPPTSNIMMKVSKFEYLAAQNLKKSISPKVFSSNLVTVNIPAKDVIGKAAPDLQNFTKNLPQNALNYSDLNYNEKQQSKTSDRPIFGRKSPNYVNVSLNEAKNINNRVVIYENGCIPKNHNFNLDHNELNNKSSSSNKNINLNKTPSPSYNRNPGPYVRSVTPSPVSNVVKRDHRRSGSWGELTNGSYSGSMENLEYRKNEAEIRRNKAHNDRIKEQEIEKAEQARLEEILNMCAEYEKQSQSDKNKPMTPNRIKTNGSLPRDKRPFGAPASPGYGTPPASPFSLDNHHKDFPTPNNHSYENVNIKTSTPRDNCKTYYENVEIKLPDSNEHRVLEIGNSYENVVIQQNMQNPQSPRTRIKTFVTSPKLQSSPKDTMEVIDNKFAVLELEQLLLENFNRTKDVDLENSMNSSKFILPLEDNELDNIHELETQMSNSLSRSYNSTTYSKDTERSYTDNSRLKEKSEADSARTEALRKEKRDLLAAISKIKRQMAEIEIQEEELHREMALEKALINGEHKSKVLELEKMESKKQKYMKRAQKIENNMRDCQAKQEEDQLKCKNKLKEAQENMTAVEKKLAATEKTSEQYEQVFEEYLQAQEQLDNERKAFEDLEFHHLEEEADWLASREELQREIVDLSEKIENVRIQIEDLEQQQQEMNKTNTPEYKSIEEQKMNCLIKLEEIRNKLKSIDNELLSFSAQESEQEISSDSDSDKSKGNDSIRNQIANMLLKPKDIMSCSVIVSHTKIATENDNMSRSYNEKILQEKSVLELGKRYPSQDDIDRISKVTTDAPITINEEQGSLGRKTIESLNELKIKRHLLLCEQGSNVIEHERQRVLALKQRVQQEVKSKWAQARQDCNSYASTGSEENSLSVTFSEDSHVKKDTKTAGVQDQTESIPPESEAPESPRPLSEVSEMSVEVGTLNRKRKPISDKQRPLTRYLPIRGSDLDLRQHIESAGHQVVLCPHVIINSSSCRGFLHKKGSKLNGWSKRWFVFDRHKHTFTYYADKSEKKARGGAYFQAIEEVYVDHSNSVKSPNPQLTFVVKTHERYYYLLAPSPEAMRIWVDVIFTGAEGYSEYEHGT